MFYIVIARIHYTVIFFFVVDPCLEENYQTLDDWQRSVNNTINGNLCDNRLTTGWYRPISLVGNSMPTECTQNGFRCGTTYPIWLNGRKYYKET